MDHTETDIMANEMLFPVLFELECLKSKERSKELLKILVYMS